MFLSFHLPEWDRGSNTAANPKSQGAASRWTSNPRVSSRSGPPGTGATRSRSATRRPTPPTASTSSWPPGGGCSWASPRRWPSGGSRRSACGGRTKSTAPKRTPTSCWTGSTWPCRRGRCELPCVSESSIIMPNFQVIDTFNSILR